MTTSKYDKAIDYAGDKGREDGLAAAGWYFDGNTSEDTCRRVLQGIDDGDPAILDTLPRPDLSGQWADGINGPELYSETCEHAELDPDDQFDSLFDEICTEYEHGFQQASQDEILRVAQLQTAD